MKGKYTKAELRDIALGAARSYLRKAQIEPMDRDYKSGLAALDDLLRINPNLLAAIWYKNASESQIRLFRKEWNDWAADARMVRKLNDKVQPL